MKRICLCAESLSQVQPCVTLWTVAHQAPLSVAILQARMLPGVGRHAPSKDLPNPGVPHHRQILYHVSHQGSPLTIWEGSAFDHYLRDVLLMITTTIYSVCEVLVVLQVFQLMD